MHSHLDSVRGYGTPYDTTVSCVPLAAGLYDFCISTTVERGQELINRDKRIFFNPCGMLVQNLLVAKRELELPNILKKLLKYDAVLIDDIGYVQ